MAERRWDIRQLRLALMKQYRQRGELIANTDLRTLTRILTEDEIVELQACRQLHRHWATFLVAESWYHRCGERTPETLLEAMRLIGEWQTME